MDENDDIEFSFFEDDDEGLTREAARPAAAQRVRLPGRAPRSRGPVGPPRPTAPLLRLVALVALVIVLLLVFGLLIQSCGSTSKHDSYASYIDKVTTIATQSTADGASLATALTTPGLSVATLDKKLYAIADHEQQNVQAAESIDPPGPLRDEHMHLLDALQLRVNGIDSLAKTFASTATSSSSSSSSTSTSTTTTAATNAALLQQDAERLTASDVIWDDFFLAPVTAQLKRDGVGGVDPPESHFISTGEDVSQHGMALVLQRISGSSTGGTPAGIHGTDLVSVEALPNGTGGATETLSSSALTTVTATTKLAFNVTINNGGDSQEVQIPITLTIDRSTSQGGPITKTVKLQLIDPGQQGTVTFTDLGEVPFAQQTTIRVDVAAVPGEKNTSNNSGQYQVIFSLPAG